MLSLLSIVCGFAFGSMPLPHWELGGPLGLTNCFVGLLFIGALFDGSMENRPFRIYACLYGLILLFQDPVLFANSLRGVWTALGLLSPLAFFSVCFRESRTWPIRIAASLL